MRGKYTIGKRILAMVVCIAMMIAYLPTVMLGATAVELEDWTVTDPGTADSWERMMGTDIDGNRYAGRVWADRSVYKDGDTVVLNSRGEEGSSFRVSLNEDEAFQVIFSALGSTMSTTETTNSTGPMDVVLVLDNSDSMRTARMTQVINAANNLLSELLVEDNDVRLGIAAYAADASTVLPFGVYTNGVRLQANNSGVITAYTAGGQRINNSYASDGYEMNTNIQAGFELATQMLTGVTQTEKRKPVVIFLTDGAANTAVDTLFKSGSNAATRQIYYSNNIDPMIALSTLLSNAYNKTRIEKHYGQKVMLYGIGVDLSNTDGSNAIIDPANNFNASNVNANIRQAYETYANTWAKGQDVSESRQSGSGWNSSQYTFRFGHEYPQGITDQDVIANINYVDTYYPVASAELSQVFGQIYLELSSAAFNPISSTTTVEGGTGVENTPLIYVDFIGQHMQIKEIQSVTLFGASYDVVEHADGSYTVDNASGINPTTKEAWNTAEDIRISVTEEADGTQKLEIRINQEILPIIMEHVDVQTVGAVSTSTITELIQDPLRVYYTLGLDPEVLLPNGKIDVLKIKDTAEINQAAGTASFYSAQYGQMNTAASGLGDSHVGFKPSVENRYYYHQANQGIFTKITDAATGKEITIAENEEYGIEWEEGKYELTWMRYEDYLAADEDDRVYTYVTYYRPTPDTTDEANASEQVTYLAYADWKYLKESVAFYDADKGTYLNDGKAIAEGEVAAQIAAYLQANPNAQLYAVLGIGSVRTSRLHNLTVEKSANVTDTAQIAYAPQYTHERAADHHENDVVIWLGNNGKYTAKIETGIALTKAVTEAMGSANDTYQLTVTLEQGVSAEPEVVDDNGDPVAFTYENNLLTIPVRAGQTVYISGIPAGTQCRIGENINGDYYKVDSRSTATVTVPTLAQVLADTDPVAQFVPAVVTNAPNKYGDLTVVKDIDHDLENAPAAMAQKVFSFHVQLPAQLAGKTYELDANNASQITATQITVGADGSFTVELKDSESVTVLGLPDGTAYTVTETSAVAGYTDTTGPVSGQIQAGSNRIVQFVNEYGYTPIKPAITVTGVKVLQDIHNTYAGHEEFTFVLSRYTESGYVEEARDTAKAGESYQFKLDTQLSEALALGEHYFRVTELEGDTKGMTYDSTRGLFAVHVTDENADGTLEYTVTNAGNTAVSGMTVTKNFTNIYDVERTHADIHITKLLTNDTGVELPLNSFHFELVNTANPDGAQIPSRIVTTDASGKATIRLNDLGEGQYTYTLTEENAGMAGMTYDLRTRNIVVTVADNGNGLTASVEIDNQVTDQVTFHNTYALRETSHTITGTKTLEGRELVNGEFSFELYETDEAFITNGIAVKQTVTNVGGGFTFSAIRYTQVGTYYYVVEEKTGGASGVTYDSVHYHITVTVSAQGEELVKSVAVHKIGHNADTTGSIAFVNTYNAAPAEYAFEGIKILHGRAARAGEFSFGLYHADELLGTVTNKGDGSFAFAPVVFDVPGTYTFTVKEIEPAQDQRVPGVSYDGAEKPVTVTVTVIDDNAKLKVSNVAVTDKNGIEITDGIVFENTYTPEAAQVTFSGTKLLKGGQLEDNDFTFHLYRTDHTFDISGKTPEIVMNTGKDFAFAPISLAAAGTYFYTITEDASAPLENVVYDSTAHHYMVQVSDLGDGQLRAVVTNVTTGVASQPAAAAGAEVTFTNATFDEAVEKKVSLADTATYVDGKQVKAGDILTYHITYTNYTGKPVEADIMDTIPKHTSYVEGSASHGGSYAGEHVNWILNVAKGESVTVSFRVKVDAEEAVISNIAAVRDGVNVYTTNEVVSHTVETPLKKDVFAVAEPAVSIDGKQVKAGDVLTYKLSFTNVSGEKVNVKISDTIPANTSYVEGSADQGGLYANGALSWQLSDVAPWATVTVTFKVKVAEVSGVKIENKALAEADGNEHTSNTVVNEVEKKAEPTAPVAPTTQPGDQSPQTGDEVRIGLFAGVMLLSATMLAVLIIGKKKEEKA